MHGKYSRTTVASPNPMGLKFVYAFGVVLFVRAVSLHKSGLSVYNRIYCIPGNIVC